MQDIFKQIFKMAIKEMPTRYHIFIGEKAVLYKGFKISKIKNEYFWQDTRYSNFYEVVDPKVTKKALENGFSVTLNEVMLHNDIDKVLILTRNIEKKDALIAYWTKESTKIWTIYNRKKNSINKDKKITHYEVKLKNNNLKKRYEKKKSLYQKKRRVISEEREDLKADKKFFESRIKLHNNLKP